MDATVIEEIANQLGMAVDTAAQFVADILPKYATLQIIEDLGFVFGSLLLIGIVCAILKGVDKWAQKQVEATKDLSYYEKFNQETYRFVMIVLMVVAGIATVVLFPLCISYIVDAITWGVCPEAKLLELAISKVA